MKINWEGVETKFINTVRKAWIRRRRIESFLKEIGLRERRRDIHDYPVRLLNKILIMRFNQKLVY